MEGQNKRTEIEIECSKCGDVFSIPPAHINSLDLDEVECQGCQECKEE